MLQTAQRFPRAGSQSFPTPAAAANADGSTTVYFGPTRPMASRKATGFATAGKGWFVLLRLYSPLQPFFDKTWRPREIELENSAVAIVSNEQDFGAKDGSNSVAGDSA